MKTSTVKIAAAIIGLVLGTPWAAMPAFYTSYLQTWRDGAMNVQGLNATETASVNSWLKTMNTDGSWTDLLASYKTTDGSEATDAPIVSRLQLLSKAWASSASFKTPAEKTELLNKLKLGTQYFLDHTISSNRTRPPYPSTELTEIPLLLRMSSPGAFSPAMLKSLAAYLKGEVSGMTGANLEWGAQPMIVRGLLEENTTKVDEAIAALHGELSQRSAFDANHGFDGIMHDYSFNQHGMFYAGEYGRAFSQDMTDFVNDLKGTSKAFPAENVKVLIDLMLEGEARTAYKGKLEISVNGRYVRESSDGGIANALKSLTWANYRVNDINAYFNSHTSGAQITWAAPSKAFWNSEYVSHHGDGWAAHLHMISARTRGTEISGTQNHQGFYLPFGTTWIRVAGDEYEGLIDYFDWSKLPGITVEQQDPALYVNANNTKNYHNRGRTSFVGGVDDSGTTSIAAYDYDGKAALVSHLNTQLNSPDAGSAVTGKRAVFFLPNAVVQLGSKFAFNTTRKVATTVNQCLARGEVWVKQGAAAPKAATLPLLANDIQWVHHDNVGYWFPTSPKQLTVATPVRAFASRDDGTANATKPTQKAFTLWFDQGTSQTSESFAYVSVPNVSRSTFQTWMTNPTVSVVSNTPTLQAIETSDHTWRGAVFHADGSAMFSGGLNVTVDRPCALILSQSGTQWKLSVADPAHGTGIIKVSASVKLTGAGATWNNSQTSLAIAMPTGDDAGKSVRLNLQGPGLSGSHPMGAFSTAMSARVEGRTLLLDHLGSNPVDVRIMTPDGKLMMSERLSADQAQLSMEGMSRGMFLLEILGEQDRISRKMIFD